MISDNANLADIVKGELIGLKKKCSPSEKAFVKKYLGTGRDVLCVRSSDRDKVVRKVSKEVAQMSPGQVRVFIDDLLAGDYCDYFSFVGKLISVCKHARDSISFSDLERWLKKTTGWMECDVLCQSFLEGSEADGRWGEFSRAIIKFRSSKNIQLRRASLVLQVKPNRTLESDKMRSLAFETLEILKGERDILITKSVSWLLRSLAVGSPQEVKKYLEENKDSLPKIAFRETMRKINTGKK